MFPIAIIGLDLWAVVASNRPPKPASRMINSTFLSSKKFPNIISGKRGLGLIQGLVINDDYADAIKITLKAFDKGLLIVPAGGNVVRIVPPLVISRREINILLDKLNLIFEEL